MNTTEQQPHTVYRAPETFTGLRMKALALWTAAGVVLVGGLWLFRTTGLAFVAPIAIMGCVPLAVAGLFLWEYSNRLIAKELPRHQSKQASLVPPPVYVRRAMSINGQDEDMGEQPVDFGVGPDVLARVASYLIDGGGTSRGAMTKSLGISQGQWSKLMTALEGEGYVVNKGRAGVDVVGDLSTLLDDVTAQMDRW